MTENAAVLSSLWLTRHEAVFSQGDGGRPYVIEEGELAEGAARSR